MADPIVSQHDCTRSNDQGGSTARAALAVCAFFALVTCMLAAPAVAPQTHTAYAEPALQVNFNAATGIATWEPSGGATYYYYGCGENPANPGDWDGPAIARSIDKDSGSFSVDFKQVIDEAIANGYVKASAQYALEIWAGDGDGAKWTKLDFAYTSNAVPFTTIADADIKKDAATGVISWYAITKADTYWCEVEGASEPTTAVSFDFGNFIDRLYAKGNVAKKSTYNVGISAYDDGALLAKWTGTFDHAPQAVTDSATAKLPVTFDASTGKATWSAVAGSNTYALGIDGAFYGTTSATKSDFAALIDRAFTDGIIAKKSSYTVVIRAYKDDSVVADWSATFAHTPKKVSGTVTVSGIQVPNLPVTFKKSTGKATWKAYAGASSYWYGIDGHILPLNGRSASFKDLINEAYTNGYVKKKDSYQISVAAYSSASMLLASWTTAFTYTPKKVVGTVSATAGTAAAKMPVTFKKTSGKATWKAYTGAKLYFASVDGVSYPLAGRSAQFKAIVDGLYLSGYVKKKSSYTIEVLACSENTEKLLARWSTTFKYKPVPNLSRAKVGSIIGQAFTGKKIKPALDLRIGYAQLKKGKHYTVTFKKNVNVGKATVVIKGKGKVKGTLKKTFKIVPATPGLKAKSIGVGTATMSWKFPKGAVDGVQLKYGYDAGMKKAKSKTIKGMDTTSLKISKLKNTKTTFVWIRSFKTVSGKKYYSDWNVVWFAVL